LKIRVENATGEEERIDKGRVFIVAACSHVTVSLKSVKIRLEILLRWRNQKQAGLNHFPGFLGFTAVDHPFRLQDSDSKLSRERIE
jgi:hypothetical protein